MPHVIALSHDGTLVARAGPGWLRLWEVAGLRIVLTLGGLPEYPVAIAFAREGTTLLAAYEGEDRIRVVLAWDFVTEEVVHAYALPELRRPVAFSGDGRILACAGRDGTVRLWALASGQELATLAGHARDVVALTYSFHGRYLATLSWDGTVLVWDLTSVLGQPESSAQPASQRSE